MSDRRLRFRSRRRSHESVSFPGLIACLPHVFRNEPFAPLATTEPTTLRLKTSMVAIGGSVERKKYQDG
jgi:hypothetical protein